MGEASAAVVNPFVCKFVRDCEGVAAGMGGSEVLEDSSLPASQLWESVPYKQ